MRWVYWLLGTMPFAASAGCGSYQSHAYYRGSVDLSGAGRHQDDATPQGNDSAEVSFHTTVYPLLRANCAGCHGASQAPLFAVEDAAVALDALTTSQKVNLNAPAQSRLVQQLLSNHNCWGRCEDNAAEMTTAIEAWAAVEQSANQSDELGSQTDGLRLSSALQRPLPDDGSTLVVEAETATLRAPMARTNAANASGGAYLSTPANNNAVLTATAANAGIATFNVMVKVPGTYRLHGLVAAPNNNSRSFFIQWDSETAVQWDLTTSAAFVWNTANTAGAEIEFQLTEGAHVLNIRQRQALARIDRWILTDDRDIDFSNPLPTEMMNVLTFDAATLATGLVGTLEVEVSTLDEKTFVFANPKLVLSAGSIHVESLKILLNGQDTGQSSTFENLNVDAGIGATLLREASTPVLAIESVETDMISILIQ